MRLRLRAESNEMFPAPAGWAHVTIDVAFSVRRRILQQFSMWHIMDEIRIRGPHDHKAFDTW